MSDTTPAYRRTIPWDEACHLAGLVATPDPHDGPCWQDCDCSGCECHDTVEAHVRAVSFASQLYGQGHLARCAGTARPVAESERSEGTVIRIRGLDIGVRSLPADVSGVDILQAMADGITAVEQVLYAAGRLSTGPDGHGYILTSRERIKVPIGSTSVTLPWPASTWYEPPEARNWEDNPTSWWRPIDWIIETPEEAALHERRGGLRRIVRDY